MGSFDSNSVKRLAKLARINCSVEEIDSLVLNLQAIVSHFDRLNALSTEGVPPCHHVLETIQSQWREDEVQESLNRKTFLENSPSHVGGMVRIPPVIQL